MENIKIDELLRKIDYNLNLVEDDGGPISQLKITLDLVVDLILETLEIQ